ncbi:hypothetical protein HaLaN_05389, partial [Haematococcus lacustris]
MEVYEELIGMLQLEQAAGKPLNAPAGVNAAELLGQVKGGDPSSPPIITSAYPTSCTEASDRAESEATLALALSSWAGGRATITDPFSDPEFPDTPDALQHSRNSTHTSHDLTIQPPGVMDMVPGGAVACTARGQRSHGGRKARISPRTSRGSTTQQLEQDMASLVGYVSDSDVAGLAA